MKNFLAIASFLSFSPVLLSSQVLAGTITQNGNQLLNNPNVSFPTISPTLIGDTLRFGTGNFFNETILKWDLFSANTLTPTSPTEVINITANLGRLESTSSRFPEDWDPTIYLWDGNNIVGGLFGDNRGGEFNSVEGTSNGSFNNTTFGPFLDAGNDFPNIGESANFNVEFELGQTETKVTLSGLGETLSFTTNNFDRTQSLSLLIARNHFYERYDINSITVTSNHVVPEPLTILGAGTAVAFGISFKRKVNQSQNKPNKS